MSCITFKDDYELNRIKMKLTTLSNNKYYLKQLRLRVFSEKEILFFLIWEIYKHPNINIKTFIDGLFTTNKQLIGGVIAYYNNFSSDSIIKYPTEFFYNKMALEVKHFSIEIIKDNLELLFNSTPKYCLNFKYDNELKKKIASIEIKNEIARNNSNKLYIKIKRFFMKLFINITACCENSSTTP